jgi:hypothetical protein
MDMNHSSVQLNDLPDEILLIIFKKLDNTELYRTEKRVKLIFDDQNKRQ